MLSTQKPYKGSIYLLQIIEYLAGNTRKSYDPKIAMPRTLLSSANKNCCKPLNHLGPSQTFQKGHCRTEIYLGSSIYSCSSLRENISTANSKRACKMCVPENNKRYHTYRRDLTPNENVFCSWEEGVLVISSNSESFHNNDLVGSLKSKVIEEVQNQNKIKEIRCPEIKSYFPMIDTSSGAKEIKKSQHRLPIRNDLSTGIEKKSKCAMASSSMNLGKPFLTSRSIFSLHSDEIDECKFENHPPRRNIHSKVLSKANNITRNPKYFEIMDFNNEAKNKLRKSVERLKMKKKLLIPVMKEEIQHWKTKRAMEENREKTKAVMQIWDYNRLRMRKNSESEVTSMQSILTEKEMEETKNDKIISSIADSIERDSEIDKNKPIGDPISILKEKKERHQFKILGVQPHLYKKSFRECIKEKETNKIKEKIDSMPLNFLVNSKRKKELLEFQETDPSERNITSNSERPKHSEVSYTSYVAGSEGNGRFESDALPHNKSSSTAEAIPKISEEPSREQAERSTKQVPHSLEANDPEETNLLDNKKNFKLSSPTVNSHIKYTEELSNSTNKLKTSDINYTETIGRENEFKHIISKLKNTSPLNTHNNEVFNNLKSEYPQQLKEKYQQSSIANDGFTGGSKIRESPHSFLSTNKRNERQNSNQLQEPLSLESRASIDLSLKSSKSSANTSTGQKSTYPSERKDKCFTKDNSECEEYYNKEPNNCSDIVDTIKKKSPVHQLTCSKEQSTENSSSFPPSKEFLSNIFYDWFPGLNVERHSQKDQTNKFSFRPDSWKTGKIEKKTAYSLRHNKHFHQNVLLKFAFKLAEKASSFPEFALAVLRAFPASAARSLNNVLSNCGKIYNNKGNKQVSGLLPRGNYTFLKKQVSKTSNLSSSKTVNALKSLNGNSRKNISYKSMNTKTTSQEEIKNGKGRNFQSKENVFSKNCAFNIDQNKMAPLLNVIKNMYKEAMLEGMQRKSFSLKSPQKKSSICKNYFIPVTHYSDNSNRRIPNSIKKIIPRKEVPHSKNSQISFHQKTDKKKPPSSKRVFKTPSNSNIFKTPSSKGVFKTPSSKCVFKTPSNSNVFKTPSSNKGSKIINVGEEHIVLNRKELELFPNQAGLNQTINQPLFTPKNICFTHTEQKVPTKGSTHPESNWQCDRYPSVNPFLIYLKNKNEKFL